MHKIIDSNLSYTHKAGRLLNLAGWLLLIIPISIIASVLIPAINTSTLPHEPAIFFVATAIPIVLTLSYLVVGNSIKNNKKWAKPSGVVMALVSLFIAPIGTIIGAFSLYYLIKGWHENPKST